MPDSRSCSVAAIANTTFQNNEARVAGGAIFANSPRLIRFSCSATVEEHPEFSSYQSAEWRNLRRLKKLRDICITWRNNSAKAHGPSVGTCRLPVVEEREDKIIAIPEKNMSFLIKGYVSGEELPIIKVQLLDELGQVPLKYAHGIEAKMSAPKTFLTCTITKPILKGRASFSGIRGFVPPGNHSLSIELIGAALEKNISIIVNVEDCSIGQVASSGGLCADCSTTSYNVGNTDTCNPCPENANCTSRVILPADGYWHITPCSVKIQRCLTAHACKFEKRSEKLQKLTKELTSCDFDPKFIKNYAETQCTKVFTVPLCLRALQLSVLEGSRGYSVWSVRRRLQFWFIAEVQKMLAQLLQHCLYSGVGGLSGDTDGYHDPRNA